VVQRPVCAGIMQASSVFCMLMGFQCGAWHNRAVHAAREHKAPAWDRTHFGQESVVCSGVLSVVHSQVAAPGPEACPCVTLGGPLVVSWQCGQQNVGREHGGFGALPLLQACHVWCVGAGLSLAACIAA
jgi:hypothetical protein